MTVETREDLGATTYLLGAGASVEAGVPMAHEMAKLVHSKIKERSRGNTHPIDVAIGGLQQRKAIATGDPFQAIEIEELYATLKALSNRDASFLAPFVGTWDVHVQQAGRPSADEAADKIVSDVKKLFSDHLRRAEKPYQPSAHDFHSLRNTLRDLVAGKGRTDPFERVAEAVLNKIVELCTISDQDKVSYLAPFALKAQAEGTWIATLNYDQSIELAAESCAVPVITGIDDSELPALPPKGSLVLAKLHGSVGWWLDGNGKLHSKNPGSSNKSEYAMVFGAGNKLQVNGPYLDLLFAFRTRLAASCTLEVCGYSFRDPHINHLLVSWLRSGRERRMIIHDPSLTATSFYGNLRSFTPNGAAIRSDDLKGRIALDPRGAAAWLAELR